MDNDLQPEDFYGQMNEKDFHRQKEAGTLSWDRYEISMSDSMQSFYTPPAN